VGDQSQNSLQLFKKSLLKYGHSTSDDLTFQKYHRQDRNLIITGVPRSGTSLLSVIINGFTNAVCLNEIIYDVGSLPNAFSLIRQKLIDGEAVPNKFNESGDLTTDTQNSSVTLKNVVIKNVDENVLIGSKVNIPYLNQLPLLLSYGYKTICLIRDPVYTIGSWCSSKASEIPEAKVTDDDMHPRWRHFNFRTNDRIERMVQIWSHYAQLLWNYRSILNILTYENLVSEHKREIEKLARFLEIESPPGNLNLKNGNIRSKYPEIEEIIKKVNLFCPIKHKFGYDDHGTKASVSFQKPKSKRKIAFFAGDCNNFHFIQPIIDRLKTSEFETRIVKSNELSRENLFNHMQWSDVSWFEWANGPIIHATKLPKVCRIVCRLHRYEAYTDSPKQIDWNKVDHFILVSSVMLDVFKELQISDIEKRTKVHIIPNAIDLTPYKFKLREKGFNIAYISRFHPDKNPALMIQILSELVKTDPRYRCFMVGRIQNIPLYQYIKHMIKQLSLQENLIYEGITSDVNSWLDDKHYILSTSIIESQGMCIGEGMAKGLKPVIHNFFGDPCAIFDRKYVFDTPKQAVEMILSEEYSPAEYRKHIDLKYNLNDVFNKYKSILFENRKNITLSPLEKKEPPITQVITTCNRAHHLNHTQRNGSNKKCFEQAQYPIFSICIPTYNRAEFLVDTIQSALNQKYEHFELLVIDDGSTDNTSELISSIKDPRLRYIKKFHTGAPDTRNRAINEANGDFIIWLGSDDILMPNTVLKYVNAINQYPEVDVFYGDLIIIDRVENSIRELKYPNFYNQNALLLNRFLFGCALPDGGSLIRRRLYQNFGGYNLDFRRAHDYEFWSRVVNKVTVKHIGSFVYKWRWHESNMSSGSVDFDTSYDIKIKNKILKLHSLKELY
jgi:glycosyltransferase involved in cell wall biosynthesis